MTEVRAGAKQHAPATARNREPIRGVLAGVLPREGSVLEVGAGTGEHAVFFAGAFPHLIWQPTDADPDSLASIAAYAAEAQLPNLRPPIFLDACCPPWPGLGDQPFDAVVSINMVHIAPWRACEGLMEGAGRTLRPSGLLLLYGPFRIDGRHTAASNAAFDQSLKAMNSEFGVRDVTEVVAAAAAHGLALAERVAMPANNLMLLFTR